jgi:Cupin-like domain
VKGDEGALVRQREAVHSFTVFAFVEAAMAVQQVALSGQALSDDWKRWIAENKLFGHTNESLVKVLVQSGIDSEVAWAGLWQVDADPCFPAGFQAVQRLKKLESLLDVYSQLGALRPAAKFEGIERRSNVSRNEFLDRYYSANKPIVLLDLMKNWKARTTWNPNYLRERCGGELVEVMTDRAADPRYEINSESHKTVVPFRDYIEHILQNGDCNDWYLVANNNLLQRKGLHQLRDDIVAFPEYLDGEKLDGGVFFWFGPAGTVTPLHHDVMNILMTQVFGRKRITLIPSEHIHHLYNTLGVYSEIDCEKPDLNSFPEFRKVTMQRFVLKPGEVLFIPVGWWHHVRSLEISVSVSFTNFLFPNDYQWHHPEGDGWD